MTMLFAGMSFTFLTAMVLGTAANAIWLQSIAPVWVLLIGVCLFGEHAISRDWLMVAFAAFGVGVIICFEAQTVAASAIVWTLGSSFFYAGVVLSLRYFRHYDPVWLATLNQLMTAAVLAPLVLSDLQLPSGMQWPYLELIPELYDR
jgi:drug/metabolite transporter (DMT)-like permease